MNPDIFMSDFERTEWGDCYYGAVGRLLTLASRFEAVAKTISLIVGIKNNHSLVDSDTALKEFAQKLRKMPLATHLSDLGLDEDSLGAVLRSARLARNEVSHELTLGMDRCLDRLPEWWMENFMDRLKSLAVRLAEGDRVVSYLASLSTNDELPAAQFLNEYPSEVAAWVCELT